MSIRKRSEVFPIKMTIVDQIEEIRRKNNSNWMDLLRLALKYAPDEARMILARINKCDQEISKLVGQLSDSRQENGSISSKGGES